MHAAIRLRLPRRHLGHQAKHLVGSSGLMEPFSPWLKSAERPPPHPAPTTPTKEKRIPEQLAKKKKEKEKKEEIASGHASHCTRALLAEFSIHPFPEWLLPPRY